jgi:LacI family transcriptional regulator
VLHKRGRVAPQTVERVEQVIREEGYTPNLFARQLSLAKHYTFSVVVPDLEQDAGYWRLPKAGMEDALSALHLQNVSLSYVGYDRYSRRSFREACEKVLEAATDGIILAPTQSEAAVEFVSRIAGRLPCVLIDASVGDGAELSFIGQDALQSGVVAGRLMHLLTPAPRRYAIIEAGEEDKHLEQRAEGFRRYFRSTLAEPDAVEFQTVPITGDTDIGAYLAPAFADRRPDGVFVTNALAYAVAEWVNGGAEEHVPVIGYDLVEANSRALKEGTLDFVIHQRPRTQGYWAVYALYRAVMLGKRVDSRMAMPIDVVMRENLDYYERKRGALATAPGADRATDTVPAAEPATDPATDTDVNRDIVHKGEEHES